MFIAYRSRRIAVPNCIFKFRRSRLSIMETELTKVPDSSPQSAPDLDADGDIPVSPRDGQDEQGANLSPAPLSSWDRAKAVVEVIAESLPVTIIMSLFTIWALFSDDIRLAAADSTADEGFMVVISIAFFLFLLEIFAASFYKEGYLCLPNFTPAPHETKWDMVKRLCNFGSFYFWLDWIATLSLIFEVSEFVFYQACSNAACADILDYWRCRAN